MTKPRDNRTRIKRRRKAERKIVLPLDPTRPLPRGLAWYVLTTEPQREHVVANWIEASGWAALVPLETRWRIPRSLKRGGDRQKREAYQIPLLPRMVLAGFPDAPQWLTVMDRYGVTGVLGINGTPAATRPGEAERLQASSEGLRKATAPRPLAAGAKATITAPGPLQGHVVEVVSIHGRHAKIVLQLFGASREAEIPVDELEAA